ncbi:hypothetical protein JSMCR1_p704 (plasmid) [Escherichia coli]|nr:hypothetical protein JSMCR1_p704 [Escherichia coli]
MMLPLQHAMHFLRPFIFCIELSFEGFSCLNLLFDFSLITDYLAVVNGFQFAGNIRRKGIPCGTSGNLKQEKQKITYRINSPY